MAKGQKGSTPLVAVSGADITKTIEVEYEGEVYEGSFSIISLNTYGKYRGQIQYRNGLPLPFGVYPEESVHLIQEDAKKHLLEIIAELPRSSRFPTRKAY
jgi:hypothetical protein